MSTPSTIVEWLATAQGVAMNPDGHYGLQCVDLADQYAQDIFGVPWSQCLGGVTGAKQLLDAAPDEYWIRTDNNPNDPNLVPKQGDVVVFAGSAINQWGHVAVVDSADASGMWVIQQDGFAPPLIWADGNWYSGKPAHRQWLAYSSNGTGPVSGWLTPRTNKLAQQDAVVAPAPSSVAGHQRVTAASVGYRKEPKASAELIQWLEADKVYDFKGWVRGESVDGNNIWFVGAYSGGYAWSGGFTDKGTHDLVDLTPPAVPIGGRVTGAANVNFRKAPNSSAEIIDTLKANSHYPSFTVFTKGESIDGNDIWFKGTVRGGYSWSGAFTDSSTKGMIEEVNTTPAPKPTPTPTPTPDKYSFTPDFDFVEYIPAALPNFMKGNFPDKPEYTVIHQFGTLGVDTVNSTINTFTNPNMDRVASSHFVVSGKRIIQMVSLKDRAYHAGTVGNNYVGIETDPAQDADTIASTKKLLAALKAKYGYELKKTLHKDVPGNSTNCGASITLSKYDLAPEIIVVPVPPADTAPTDIPEIPVIVPPVDDAEVEAAIDEFLAELRKILLLLRK